MNAICISLTFDLKEFVGLHLARKESYLVIIGIEFIPGHLNSKLLLCVNNTIKLRELS